MRSVTPSRPISIPSIEDPITWTFSSPRAAPPRIDWLIRRRRTPIVPSTPRADWALCGFAPIPSIPRRLGLAPSGRIPYWLAPHRLCAWCPCRMASWMASWMWSRRGRWRWSRRRCWWRSRRGRWRRCWRWSRRGCWWSSWWWSCRWKWSHRGPSRLSMLLMMEKGEQ